MTERKASLMTLLSSSLTVWQNVLRQDQVHEKFAHIVESGHALMIKISITEIHGVRFQHLVAGSLFGDHFAQRPVHIFTDSTNFVNHLLVGDMQRDKQKGQSD